MPDIDRDLDPAIHQVERLHHREKVGVPRQSVLTLIMSEAHDGVLIKDKPEQRAARMVHVHAAQVVMPVHECGARAGDRAGAVDADLLHHTTIIIHLLFGTPTRVLYTHTLTVLLALVRFIQ